MAIARVILDLSLDRAFDYRIPPSLAAAVGIGSRVTVPFGHGVRTGYVVALPPRAQVEDLKDIAAVETPRPFFSAALLRLGEWMADYYCCPRERAILAMLPAVVRAGRIGHKTRNVVRLADDTDPATCLETLGQRAPKQSDLIRAVARTHTCSQTFLTQHLRIPASAIHALRKRGWIVIEEEKQERDPFAAVQILPSQPLRLTDEQAVALDTIRESLDAPRRAVVLLHGVTGSGKTEVYLQAIAGCIEAGGSAIVLVPEIALTPQTTERFRARFGNQVSVLHSRLSDGERFDEWTRINEGRVRIAVGARSALFAPFRDLALIIVDEEHETSYKQDRAPRYQARDVAVMRGRLENATVVLGTATPALESYHNVERGKYRLATLERRVDDQQLPAMECVDMAVEADAAGRPQILSRRLVSLMRQNLENGEQTMLFLNRRGYATRLQCLKCGYTAQCDACELSFTYHRTTEHLICHMCGDIRHAPTACPQCADPNVRYGGIGTQKVEAAVKGAVPYVRVARMDADTMTRKDAYREALDAFRSGAIDVLVGTQMIAKGLHFPNVTLVGVVFADLSLNLPDFRSGERTFQLLVQVAGRAGRGELPGRVIVQTYTPHHPVIRAALAQNYNAFYKMEIDIRREAGFPPARRMAVIHFRSEDHDQVAAASEAFARYIAAALPPDTEALPPMPGPIPKKRNQYFYQILLITDHIPPLSRILKQALATFKRPRDVAIAVDIDPYSLM